MIRESEVRERVRAVLANTLALDQFEDWLAQHSWNMHLDSDPSVQGLVTSIQMALDEYAAGGLTEAKLRAEFAALLEMIILAISITTTGAHSIRPVRSLATAYQVPQQPILQLV